MNGSLIGVSARIRRSILLLSAIGIFFAVAEVDGQSKVAFSLSQESKIASAPSLPQIPGVEILSDTGSVDLGAYITKVLATIKNNWIPAVPEEARPPHNMQGQTLIRFSINPDGTIRAMRLERSSQNANIDQAAWKGILGVGQFAPLPAEFKGHYLDLRIGFFTNLPLPKKTSLMLP